MDTKQWLSRAYKIDLQIESKEEQIAVWRSLASKTTACYSSNGSACGINNKVENYCSKIIDAENELEEEKEKLIDVKQEIKAAIDKVNDVCSRVLLEQRYLLGKNWEDIAEFMGYTEQYIQQVFHSQALNNIKKIVG